MLSPHGRPNSRTDARSEQGAYANRSSNALLRAAIEPSGHGAYVEAVREWIERVSPRPAARPPLHLVR